MLILDRGFSAKRANRDLLANHISGKYSLGIRGLLILAAHDLPDFDVWLRIESTTFFYL